MAARPSLRIALLLDAILSDHQKDAIAGVCRAARAARIRVLIVAGGPVPAASDEPLARNFIFQLVPTAHLDGYVVLGTGLARVCGIERFRRWIADFAPVSSVVIGLKLEELPHVYADSTVGICAAIRHLVEIHGRRRIACIRGLELDPEAGARFRAYQAGLEEQNLRFDERLAVEQPRLDWNAGMASVGTLFDKRRFTPRNLDSIVCGNDDVARGVLEALRSRSVAVPEQIAVVGCDDGPSAASTNPPLTTVAQRIERQAYTATCSLIDALERGGVPQSEVLPTVPVFRSSCGCVGRMENDSSNIVASELDIAHTSRLALLEHRSSIAAALVSIAGNRLVNAPGWELRILDALLRDLTLGDTTHTVRELESAARRHAAGGGDISACQDVLTALRLQVLHHGGARAETRPLLEDLFQEARLVLGRVGIDVERSRRETLDRRMRSVAAGCRSLLVRDSLAELVKHLDEQLPALGIKSFVISRFAVAGDPTTRLEVVARRSQGEWRAAEGVVSAQNLGLDDALDQAGIVVVEPLYLESMPLGVAAFTWGAEVPEHYEELAELLSSALRAAALQSSALQSTNTE